MKSETHVDDELRRLNGQMLGFSWSSLLMVLLYNDACFDRTTLEFSDDFERCSVAIYAKAISWAFYLLYFWRLIMYYKVQAGVKARTWGYVSDRSAFMETELWRHFLFEAIINACIPLPFLKVDQTQQTLNHLINFVSVGRLYLALRLMRDYSIVYKQRSEIRNQQEFKMNFEYEVTLATVFKAYFYQYTGRLVLFMFSLCYFTMTYFVWLVEREYWWCEGPDGGTLLKRVQDYGYPIKDASCSQGQLNTLQRSGWFTIVTMTTLGYGDITPQHVEGKIVAVVCVLIGVILMSLLVGVVTNKLQATRKQRVIMEWLSQRDALERARRHAACVLQIVWRIHISMKADNHMRLINDEQPLTLSEKERRVKADIRPHYKKMKHAIQKIAEIETHFREIEGAEYDKMLALSKQSIQELDILINGETKKRRKKL